MNIICKVCEKEKDSLEFEETKSKFGRDRICVDCRVRCRKRDYDHKRKLELAARESSWNGSPESNKKFCPKCNKLKDVSFFTSLLGNIKDYCGDCRTKREKEQNLIPEVLKKKKDAGRRRYLAKNYNITPEKYQDMLRMQNGGCFLCGKTEEKNRKLLAVDHDHETGEVRDLLCGTCNLLIGIIEKNDLRPKKLFNYLEKHRSHVIKNWDIEV